MIQIQDLRKVYGAHVAVRNASFRADDGAITGLLGINGAGKTTALRMICGVLRPDGGSVAIDGREDGGIWNLGALLDHTGLYERLTARENLAYFGRLRGLTGAPLKRRVEEVLSSLDLQSVADRRARGFSQGERMKVALGRAMLHSPGNLVLDEPTNALDVLTVRSLRNSLRALRDAGVCVLFSSHVLEEVRVLCDAVVILSHGRVVAEGPPQQLCLQAEAETLEDAFVKFTMETAEC